MRSRSLGESRMLGNLSVLLIEDDPYVALDLSSTIEGLDGSVVGPTRDAEEAIKLLASETIGAAIVDWRLLDGNVSRVMDLLSAHQIPFVIHSTASPPAGHELHSEVPVIIKPVMPRTVVARLVVEIRKDLRRLRPPSVS